MIIVQDFEKLPIDCQNTTLMIGNFDSVHKGHQYLISQAKKISQESNTKLALLSFSPHPYNFFNPNTGNITILTPSVKEQLLKKSGVEIFFIKKFDKDFSSLSAIRFIEDFLVKKLAIKNLVVGTNFRFGNKKTGDIHLLSDSAKKHNFTFHPVALMNDNEIKISTSLIREHLIKGETNFASNMLGYDYFIEGEVIEGDKRGRKIGFPTANVDVSHIINPKHGVYSAKVQLPGCNLIYNAVANIGPRPTIDNQNLLEAHIFDFNEDIYGKSIKIYLKKYIRSQVKFKNLSELKIQIKLDAQKAKELLNK